MRRVAAAIGGVAVLVGAGVPLALVLGGGSGTTAAARSHLVVIVMENKSYDDVIGSSEAPYIKRLARRSALATRFHAISHPSLPNYLALTGGSTFGVQTDCAGCAVQASNLVDQLERRGISWKAYMEDLPHPCFLGAGSAGYVKRHDPFVHYRDIASDARRCAHVVPLTQLDSDLRHGGLPAFAWISPNLCHDMHDCGVRAGDRFLAGIAPRLLRALGPGGALVVTWDEGAEGDDAGCCRYAHGGRIATIVAGPTVRAGTRLTAPLDHYGLLRTIDEAFGLRPLRAAACPCSRSLRAAFARPLRIR